LIKYLKQYRFFLCLILISSYSFSETIVIKPSEDSYTEIQEALIFANSGDIIHLSEGLYEFEDSLSIDVDGVTLQGDGMKKNHSIF